MKTVIIVDDHELVRLGIKNWLETKSEWKVTADVSSINECLSALEEKQPSIALVDVDLGTENGFDLVPVLKNKYPDLKIIMYSMYDQISYVEKAEQLGTHGYISKAAKTSEFKKGLDAVYNGNIYLEKRIKESQKSREEMLSVLSKKELQIFNLILDGKTNDEISSFLKIKKNSLEVYISLIYEKTFSKNRADLTKKFK